MISQVLIVFIVEEKTSRLLIKSLDAFPVLKNLFILQKIQRF